MRLCKRFRHLTARGKHAHQVVVAIARDMAAFIWAIARDGPIVREALRGGTLKPWDGRQPRCGAILASVKRRQKTRRPRSRPAPDGRQSGGTQPTDIRVINRRDDWLLLVQWSVYKSGDKNDKRPSMLWLTTSPLTPDVISTLGVRRGGKRERSGRCQASAARLCYAADTV